MSRQGSDRPSDPMQPQSPKWDIEGAAETAPSSIKDRISVPKMADAELGALHIRVIALENLVISLLATASERQLEIAREMAPYISPRPGFTRHPLTTQAAARMIDLVERASRFCGAEPS